MSTNHRFDRFLTINPRIGFKAQRSKRRMAAVAFPNYWIVSRELNVQVALFAVKATKPELANVSLFHAIPLDINRVFFSCFEVVAHLIS